MKENIYIGEKFSETIPANSTLMVGNTTTTLVELSNPSTESVVESIDTSTWAAGLYSVVLNQAGKISVSTCQVIDPLAEVTEIQDARNMVSEIDQIIEDRAQNAVTQVTINNKTIINESLDVLMRLRTYYVNKANSLLKKQSASGNGGMFKSITVFRGK